MLEYAAQLFDPAAMAIVLGGSIAAAILRSTRRDLERALASVVPLVRAAPDRDADAAEQSVRQIERLVELKGIACADRIKSGDPFILKAAARLADAPSIEAFGEWAVEEIEQRRVRHEAVLAVWRSAADAAPSMGMIGTVLGLIGMFMAMDDPARIGPAMALAMLTTLYGLCLGTILFGTIAARLERLSVAERAWQSGALGRLEAVVRGQPMAEVWLRKCRRPAQ